MATVVKNTKEVEVLQTVKRTVYVLDLSMDEAKALKACLFYLSGPVEGTVKKFTDLIVQALDEAGVPTTASPYVGGTAPVREGWSPR